MSAPQNPFSEQVLRALAAGREAGLRMLEQRRLQQSQQSEEEQRRLQNERQSVEDSRRAQLFPYQLEQAKTSQAMGAEQLKHLQLQNEQLAQQNKLFDSDESLDSLVSQSVSDLGELKGDEKALITAARAEAKQRRTLAPIADAVGRIMSQRGISARQEDSQGEAWKRLLYTQNQMMQRMLQGQAVRGGNEEDAANFARRIATGEMKISEVPREARAGVLRALMGTKMVPQKTREDLRSTTAAEEAIDKFEKTLTEFVNNKTVANGIRLRAQREAFTRLLGRAMGERGVFTDYDKEDFARLLGPGLILSTADPQLAYQQINDVRELLRNVKERKLSQAMKIFREDEEAYDENGNPVKPVKP